MALSTSTTTTTTVRNTHPAERQRQRQKSRWDPRPHHDDPTVKTYDFAYLTGVPDPSLAAQFIEGFKTLVAPAIAQPLLLRTLILIFGGCCSNVYTLESILTLSSSTGTLITCLQFISIALYTLPTQLTFHVVSPPDPPPLQPTQRVWLPRLKSRKVPLRLWLQFAAQFVLINMLNNAAFGYKISLPLHIILRSAGPVASMLVGRVWAGKIYGWRKILSVILLFTGVVLAALSDAGSKTSTSPASASEEIELSNNKSRLSQNTSDILSSLNGSNVLSSANTTSTASTQTTALMEQAPGFALLSLALLLSAVMGIWSDGIYVRYGRTTAIANEQVFYGHLLSLPFFLLRYGTLTAQWNTLMTASAIAYPKTSIHPMEKLRGLPPMAKFMHMMAATREKHRPRTLQERLLAYVKADDIPKAVVYLFLNSMTQIACISGVHRLSTQTSALTVSIVLNVRKVVSLLLSIWLFGNVLPIGVLVGAAIVFFGGGLYGLPEKRKEVKKEEKEKGTDGETKKNR